MLSQHRGSSYLPIFKISIQSKEGAVERLVVKPSENLGLKFECVKVTLCFSKF